MFKTGTLLVDAKRIFEIDCHSFASYSMDFFQSECISAHDIAVDKPSDAFLQFLEKYYSLSKPIWQSTNFVVFPSFFKDKTALVSHELKEEKRRGARSAKMSSDDFIPSPAQPRDSASGIIHGTGSIFNR